MKPSLRVLVTKALPIEQQLAVEEALLRTTHDHWALFNIGTEPRIVLGISGKQEELIDAEQLAIHPIPLVRRYSGGGTVVVDEKTIFMTLLVRKGTHFCSHTPEGVLTWAYTLCQRAFFPHVLTLEGQDYALGGRKCAGNAQYFTQDSWVHHTCFLWDFCPNKMRYLLFPKKTPAYRQGRSHEEFLTSVHPLFPSIEVFLANIQKELAAHFSLFFEKYAIVEPHLSIPHRKTTRLYA